MQDGLAERGDDGGGDRRKAVLPFFAKGKKRRTDGTYSMTVPALQTVKAYVCSIVDLYRTQQLIGMKDMLQQPHPRSTVYRTMIAKYQERIAGNGEYPISIDVSQLFVLQLIKTLTLLWSLFSI